MSLTDAQAAALAQRLRTLRAKVAAGYGELFDGLDAAIQELTAPPGPAPVLMLTATPRAGAIDVTWTWDGPQPASWRVGRNGTDVSGAGPWDTKLPGNAIRSFTLLQLRPGTMYKVFIQALHADGGTLDSDSVDVTTPAAPPIPYPPPKPEPGASRSGLPWNSGAFTAFNPDRIKDVETRRGALLDHAATFTYRESGWQGMANPGYLEVAGGLPVTVGMPLWPKDSNVDEQRDDVWAKLAKDLAAYDPTAAVRLAWEMNIGQYWQINPGNRAKWVARWRRNASIMLDVEPRLRIGWNPNQGADQSGVNTRQVFEEVASLCTWVGPDTYDIWEPIRTAADAAKHRARMDEWRLLGAAHGCRLAVPEWGVWSGTDQAGHSGGDNPLFVKTYVEYFREHAPGIEFESYFDEPMAYCRTALAQNPKSAAQLAVSLKAAIGGGA
jgi:hypothetical protein